MLVRSSALAIPLLALGLLGGCGSGGSPGPDMMMTGEFYDCSKETRAMPYAEGMQVASSADKFTVKLLQSQPGPPIKGANTWQIEIDETATGLPLDGLDISVLPWMPDHNHGSLAAVVVTPETTGQYQLDPMYLSMSGLWEIRFTIVGTMVGGGTTDAAVIKVCIP